MLSVAGESLHDPGSRFLYSPSNGSIVSLSSFFSSLLLKSLIPFFERAHRSQPPSKPAATGTKRCFQIDAFSTTARSNHLSSTSTFPEPELQNQLLSAGRSTRQDRLHSAAPYLSRRWSCKSKTRIESQSSNRRDAKKKEKNKKTRDVQLSGILRDCPRARFHRF